MTLEGDLTLLPVPPLDSLLARTAERADVVAARAQAAQARAERGLAAHAWVPDLTLSFESGREDDAAIRRGAIGLAVPLFDRGGGTHAAAAAHAEALEAAAASRARAADTEVRAAYVAYDERRALLDDLTQSALPALAEVDRGVHRAYAAGQIGLADAMLMRREALDTRLALLDHLEAAALAALTVRVRAGVQP